MEYKMLKLKAFLRDELPVFLTIIVLLFAARSSLADHYYVPSGSMEYTLMSGDRVVVNKMAYGFRIPFTKFEVTPGDAVSRGDVVIFDSPRDGVRLIKRIVGVGGDRVEIRDGGLLIDGEAMSIGVSDIEKFGDRLVSLNLQHGGGPDMQPAQIPAGMLLAVGDHRGRSLDGRYFGLVAEDEVYGKALGVYRRRDEGFVWRSL
jgi:signal peptidase I